MSDLLGREITELNHDARLMELLVASVDGNNKTIIHILANDIPVRNLRPTTAAVQYALRLVHPHRLRKRIINHAGMNSRDQAPRSAGDTTASTGPGAIQTSGPLPIRTTPSHSEQSASRRNP